MKKRIVMNVFVIHVALLGPMASLCPTPTWAQISRGV